MTKLNLLFLDIVKNQPFDLMKISWQYLCDKAEETSASREDFYESRGVILLSK